MDEVMKASVNRLGPYYYRVKKNLLNSKADWLIQMKNKFIPFIWITLDKNFSDRSNAYKKLHENELLISSDKFDMYFYALTRYFYALIAKIVFWIVVFLVCFFIFAVTTIFYRSING